MKKCRVIERRAGNYVAQAKIWFLWQDIGPSGHLIEEWDNSGDQTLDAALARVDKFRALNDPETRFPRTRWVSWGTGY